MSAEPHEPSLTVEAGFHDHATEVSVRGTLDTTTAPLLAETLALALERQPHDLVLDLTGVIVCDCAALSVITPAPGRSPFARLVIRPPALARRRRLTLACPHTGAESGPGPWPGRPGQDELGPAQGSSRVGHRPLPAP